MTSTRRPLRMPVSAPEPVPTPPGTSWDLVERVLRSPRARTVFLSGPPGIGKTWAAYHVGRIESLYALTLTEDTATAELRGHYLPVGESRMVWHDGPVTKAMREGARLVLNEISHASAEILSLLHPVLENLDTARLTLPNNDTVVAAPGFHCISTDNCPIEDLPPALRDRFGCVLEIREPHPAALAGLSDTLRRAALRCFALEPERRIGLRAWLSLQSLMAEFTLAEACTIVFGPGRGALVHDAIVLGAAP